MPPCWDCEHQQQQAIKLRKELAAERRLRLAVEVELEQTRQQLAEVEHHLYGRMP